MIGVPVWQFRIVTVATHVPTSLCGDPFPDEVSCAMLRPAVISRKSEIENSFVIVVDKLFVTFV